MAKQVEGATVDVLGSHDMVAGLRDVAHRVFDGCCTGCDGEAGGAAFERCDAVLEHTLGGVGQAAVDVARVLEAEAGLSVIEVMEDVARGGVDRDRAGIGGGIRLFLADVQLEGLEAVVVVLFSHGGAPWFGGVVVVRLALISPALQPVGEVLIETLGQPRKPCNLAVIALAYNRLMCLAIHGIDGIGKHEKLVRKHATRRTCDMGTTPMRGQVAA